MRAAVGLMDGLGLDGDRCIRVIPRQYLQVYKSKLIIIVKMNRFYSFVLKRIRLWEFSGKFVVYADNNNLPLLRIVHLIITSFSHREGLHFIKNLCR